VQIYKYIVQNPSCSTVIYYRQRNDAELPGLEKVKNLDKAQLA